MSEVDSGGHTVSATRFAELTGVSRERLRTWERRYGFPRPSRVAGGPRRYALADVARVVAVRRAAADGAPLPVAVERVTAAAGGAATPDAAFRSAVELAPVPVALLSGPEPLTLEWANAALRAIDGVPGPGAPVVALDDHAAGAVVREHFTREMPPLETELPAWGRERGASRRSLVYRLPVAPGERPLVAVVGVETRGEHRARAALSATETDLARLRARAERHDRWLDALAALAREFQHEPGPDVIGSALDILIRQTRAVDAALAGYVTGRLALHGSRRGALAGAGLTVAAHPEVGRALRDAEGTWLEPTTLGALGVPRGLHAAGLPITVAGETLGMLVMVFDEVEPHDADNRRLLTALSAAVGFALLRDRLVRELQAAISAGGERPRAAAAPTRFGQRAGAGPPLGG